MTTVFPEVFLNIKPKSGLKIQGALRKKPTIPTKFKGGRQGGKVEMDKLVELCKELGIKPDDPRFQSLFKVVAEEQLAQINSAITYKQKRLTELEEPVPGETCLAEHNRLMSMSQVSSEIRELREKRRRIVSITCDCGLMSKEEAGGVLGVST